MNAICPGEMPSKTQYSLSAHADSEQLIGIWFEKVQPREKLFLVHGDTKARKRRVV